MFSGVSLAKAYSPLTARELSSGEHAQRQAEGTPEGLPEAKAAHVPEAPGPDPDPTALKVDRAALRVRIPAVAGAMLPPGARPATPTVPQATEAPPTQGSDQPAAEEAPIAPEATQLAPSTQASEVPLWSQEAEDAGEPSETPAEEQPAEPAAGADDETPM